MEPNWSNTRITLRGEGKRIEEVAKNIKENGFDWGETKMPIALRAYSSLVEVVNGDEWREYAKERRNKEADAIDLCLGQLQKMKKSVADRLLSRYTFASILQDHSPDWYNWRLANWGTIWNMDLEDADVHISILPSGEAELSLSFSSPWNGPWVWFGQVCKAYGLSGTYTDWEPHFWFFREIEVEDGEIIKDKEDRYVSPLALEYRGISSFLDEYSELDDPEEAEEIAQQLLNVCKSEADKEKIRKWLKGFIEEEKV